jgi:hypothetical protein
MTLHRWMMAAAAVAVVLPAYARPREGGTAQPVPQAATSPLVAVYRVSGVSDNGGEDYTGVATTFICSSSSSVAEKIRFLVKAADGTIVSDAAFNFPTRRTFTAATHVSTIFIEDVSLYTGLVDQGVATISSTTTNITCSAMIVDAAASVPNGIALHLQRFNPIAGTQE